MAQKSPLNRFVTEQSERLFKTTQSAKKVTTPPLGMEQVAKRDLRRRWPQIGKEARVKVMKDLATRDDPEGVRAIMRILQDAS